MDSAPQVVLNPAQQEVVDRGLLTSGFSAVLQLPTGAGKTWLAEQAIGSTLQGGGRAIYLTPLRALANELVERWRQRFQGHEVGVFTGEHGKGHGYPIPFERAQLLVMTPERLDACTRHWRAHWGWFPQVSLLVVDELHLLGERRRGPRLEGALMRARRLNPFLQLLCLSATLGNREELADWLGGVHFGSGWREVPITWRCVRYRRATDKPQLLKDELARCSAGGGQSLVFVQSRRRAESISKDLCESGIPAAHHHAGLDAADRQRVERAFRRGDLRVLVSTGTLEMGLNLPARQVVLFDLQGFDGADFRPLSVCTVWQRAGRAGRRGLDTRGEVVLLTAAWDRGAERYVRGEFERIVSGLTEPRALAEQVLAEVSSGFARTRPQLARNLQQSLAAHQGRLPALGQVVDEMVDAGMLVEAADPEPRRETLRATRLGRIAVRQMLAPSTVVQLARALLAESAERLTFFDLLIICAQTDDCEPVIPVDLEEIEEVGACLSREHSTLLSGTHEDIAARFELRGRRLLAAIKTALIAREWTRRGSSAEAADAFGCYAFEVRRLSESLGRILMAAVGVVSPPAQETAGEEARPETALLDDEPTLRDRVRALAAMIAHGVDEEVVTLTFVPGIGGTLARRLRDAGITNLEDLALAEPDDVAQVRGISRTRAERWVDAATELLRTRSACSFHETGATITSASAAWPLSVDPYRLRRALELRVCPRGEGEFGVDGGLEPHRVRLTPSGSECDCADAAAGRTCKHVFAVRLHLGDPELCELAERLSSDRGASGLDLFQLWFEGARR